MQKADPRRGWGLPGRAVPPAPRLPPPRAEAPARLGSERAASAGSTSRRPPAASPGILHPYPPLLPAPAVKATPRRGPGMPSPSPPSPPAAAGEGGCDAAGGSPGVERSLPFRRLPGSPRSAPAAPAAAAGGWQPGGRAGVSPVAEGRRRCPTHRG